MLGCISAPQRSSSTFSRQTEGWYVHFLVMFAGQQLILVFNPHCTYPKRSCASGGCCHPHDAWAYDF